MNAAQEQILSVVAGASGLWSAAAADADGVAVAFSASDTLSAVVWTGDDQAQLLAPSTAWISAPAGTFTVSLSAVQSAQTPGLYRLQVYVLRASDGARLCVLDAWLSITEAAGSATAPATYCSLRDLRDHGGGEWLDSLQKAEGLTNFARERARARSWLDGIIIRRYRPWSSTKQGNVNSVSGPIDGPNSTIADKLAANKLIVDDGIRELCALKALELICRQRVGLDADDGYAKKAAYFARLASSTLAATVALIDPDASGAPAYAIHLGILSIR